MVRSAEASLLLGLFLVNGSQGFNFLSGVRVNKPYRMRNEIGLQMVISLEPSTSSKLLSEESMGSAATFMTPPESDAQLTFDPVRCTFTGDSCDTPFPST